MNPEPDYSSFILHPSSFRVLLFGGKGGVGKTTISTRAALYFAQTRKVVLFTTDPASSLGDLFLDRQPTTENLVIESLDADALYARFLAANLESFLEIGDRGTYLDRGELRRFFELSLPGLDELMAWMHIGELAEEHADALIVVDTAPTGHTLRMLSSADHFRQLAKALDAMQEKHRSMVFQFTRRDVRDAVDAFIDDFEQRARSRRELLTDPARAAFIPVLLSEPWVVEQTVRLIAEVRAAGIDVPLTVLNRAVEVVDCELDVERQQRDAAARAAVGGRLVDVGRWCGFGVRRPQLSMPAGSRRNGRLEAGGPILFLAGKGGVGKTTSAASIALQKAKANPDQKFVVISVDPAHSLRDVFANEKPPANLEVEIVDTKARWRRFRDTLGAEIEKAIDSLTPTGVSVAHDGEAMRQLIEIAPPGADELFAVQRLAELVADASLAGVIVDTAPTGHFLRLLDLPKTAGEWVRELMRILLRYRELISSATLGEELIASSRALKELDAALRSDRTRVLVVTRPEPIVLAETNRLIAEIEKRGIALGGVIANYVTPDNACQCDQATRADELTVLGEIEREVVIVERRDAPVTRLDELASLVPLLP
jgi:arsenite-transporting ATPase